jgi:hypothetical protein
MGRVPRPLTAHFFTTIVGQYRVTVLAHNCSFWGGLKAPSVTYTSRASILELEDSTNPR